MFGGTELETAYAGGGEVRLENFESQRMQKEPDTMVTDSKSPSYNPTIPIDPIHISQTDDTKQQINELQHQLKRQKELNIIMQKDVASIYDRFASKKKDVLKLLNVSLTVLLAISINYVMSDLIKGYIMNNDFSSNKETLIKFSYPLVIFLLMWSLKVFNRWLFESGLFFCWHSFDLELFLYLYPGSILIRDLLNVYLLHRLCYFRLYTSIRQCYSEVISNVQWVLAYTYY